MFSWGSSMGNEMFTSELSNSSPEEKFCQSIVCSVQWGSVML